MSVSLYRAYIDEVGNHDLNYADDPNQRFLSLTGVILESTYTLDVLQPEMDRMKRAFFQRDPDEPVILHRKEMVNKRRPFHSLKDADTERQFNDALLDCLERWEYRVITVVIDKRAHRDQYRVWRYHPYHYCLSVLLERFVLYLCQVQQEGDVLVESRGGREDDQLKQAYEHLYSRGTNYVPASRFQERLTSSQLKAKPKSANIAGLQLADLIAHPSRREILSSTGLMDDDRATFGDQICAILHRGKYHCHPQTGQVMGYGQKLLP